MTSFRNHLIFGKFFFKVAPFQCNSRKVGVSTLSGINLNLQVYPNRKDFLEICLFAGILIEPRERGMHSLSTVYIENKQYR